MGRSFPVMTIFVLGSLPSRRQHEIAHVRNTASLAVPHNRTGQSVLVLPLVDLSSVQESTISRPDLFLVRGALREHAQSARVRVSRPEKTMIL